MKNTMRIVVQKTKQQYQFFVDDQAHTLTSLYALCQKEHTTICHVQTMEEGRLLMDCYIPFQPNDAFKRRLVRAAKAKV